MIIVTTKLEIEGIERFETDIPDELINRIFPEKKERKEDSDVVKILEAVKKIPSPYVPVICDVLEVAVKAFENPEAVKEDVQKVHDLFQNVGHVVFKLKQKLGIREK